MSLGKTGSLLSAILLLAMLVMIGCEGDLGPKGPSGVVGDDGDPGDDRMVDPITTRTFGLFVINGNESGFSGNLAVTLSADESVTGQNVVLAKEVSQAPSIDGINDGTAEWGDVPSTQVALSPVYGEDNGITEATVLAAYDNLYLYMQVRWSEVAVGGYAVYADTMGNAWKYMFADTIITQTSDTTADTTVLYDIWSRGGGEDQLLLAWDVSGIPAWSTSGAGTIFDEGEFVAPADGDVADLWMWQSTQTYYVDLFADMTVHSLAEGGLVSDVGTVFAQENGGETVPDYIRRNSSPFGSPFPLTVLEFGPFDNTIKWRPGAMVPGYLHFTPSGSVADIVGRATFSEGEWTLELRRYRNTGDGNDVVF